MRKIKISIFITKSELLLVYVKVKVYNEERENSQCYTFQVQTLNNYK